MQPREEKRMQKIKDATKIITAQENGNLKDS